MRTMEKINFEYGEFRGVVRSVDALGRIALPSSFRREIGLKLGDKVEIFMTTKNEMVIRKIETVISKNEMEAVGIFMTKTNEIVIRKIEIEQADPKGTEEAK